MDSIKKKEKELCPLYRFIVRDGFGYCFSFRYNLFIKFSMVTGELEYKKTVDRYSPNDIMLFRLICLEDKIVAFPYIANHIIIWKLQSMEIQELQLPIKYADDLFLRKFSTYVQRENKILLFPGNTDYICQIDLTSNNVKKVLNVRQYLLEKYNFCYSFFAEGSYLKDNEVYLGCSEINKLIKYDIKLNRLELVFISELDGEIRCICGDGANIFIFLSNGKLVIRNIDTFETQVMRICDKNEMKYWNTGEEHIEYYHDHIFVFSYKIELSKKIKVSDGKVVNIFEKQSIWNMKCQNSEQEVFFGCFDKGTIYVYSNEGVIYYFDADSLKELGSIHLNYDIDELLQWIKKGKYNMKTIYEDKYICNINDLTDIITKVERIKEQALDYEQIGEIIYQKLSER